MPYPQAKLRIFQPHRSCTALGYIVDSREVFVAPQKNRLPAGCKERERGGENQHALFLCAA